MTLGITNTFLGTVSASGGGAKILLSATPAPSATVSTYSGYIVFKFTASGTLNVGAGAPGTADVLCVKGGASGGGSGPTQGGIPFSPYPVYTARPGGAGGLTLATPATAITGGSPIPVVVGGTNTDSTFGPLSSSTGTPAGGGGGGAAYPNNQPPSKYGGAGGAGNTNDYETGSNQNYGGGGGGGSWSHPGLNETYPAVNPIPPAAGGAGGAGGGGGGGRSYYGAIANPNAKNRYLYADSGTAGTANTGGGGGGAGAIGSLQGTRSGGTGGSGVVIARFPDAQFTTV